MVYVPSPLLVFKLPGNGSALVELDVSLNVFLPVLNLTAGAGVVFGFLKKKDPYTSPKVSVISLISVTFACAPLVSPRRTISFTIRPLNLPRTSSIKELISMFNTVEDAEYTVGRVTFLLYGLRVNTSVGLLIGPFLWFGLQILTENSFLDPTYPLTVSP